MSCPLCEKKREPFGWYWITVCKTCNVPMIISGEHKPEFTEQEREEIRRMFPNDDVRWKQRQIEGHAHCHIMRPIG